MGRPRSTPALNSYFKEDYLPDVMQSKRSWEIDERLFRKYVDPSLGTAQLSKIKRIDILEWRESLLKAGLASATCNRIFSVFQSVMSHAVNRNLILVNPCSHIAQLRPEKRTENFLSINDISRVMQYLENDPSVANRALQLLIMTGAKKFEILNARWEDVDLDKAILKAHSPDKGKARDIVLSSQACTIIRSIPRHKGCPWLFPSRDMKRPYRSLSQNWLRMREKLGLGNICLIDLRHTFASFLINSGSTPAEVQRILGISNSETTMRYFRNRQDSLVNVVECATSGIQMALAQGARANDLQTKTI